VGKADELRERLRQVEQELAAELERIVEQNHNRFRYTVSAGRVRFETSVRSLHRRQRKGLFAYLRNAPIAYVLTAPFTYGLILPLLAMDIAVNVFQQICFRTYGINIVRRRDYLVFDRQLLGYLNAIEKLNCVYCSYANGLISFVREVAARTEQFWCPIKHARRMRDEHDRMEEFFDYGDAAIYGTDLPRIRAKLLD
jgi:hypothetical protein